MTSGLSSAERERVVFLGLLRSDPAFLLRHLPSLSKAVYRRMNTALTLRLSSRHRGRKQWPRWLEANRLEAPTINSGAAYMGCLPMYPDTGVPFDQSWHRAPAEPVPAVTDASADLEDYFAQNRWRFLVRLAFEGPAATQAAFAECRRWIDNNRDRNSPAWECYSACERVANLLVFLARVRATLEAPVLREFLGFTADSASWIYAHLEYYGPSEGFNHILNNGRALVMAGVATGDERMFGVGVAVFRNCLPELVCEGGFLRERSSHYQLIVLNWVLDAWHFCAAWRGADCGEARYLRSYAERMLSAASLLCDAAGRFITIGDVSPDAPPAQTLARLSRLYPEVWPLPGKRRPSVEQVDGWFRLSCGEQTVLGHFPSGAYPFGFLTHGHCDLTSFVWRHQSREVLADNGRYRYTPDAISLMQKSATGHNVPLVNGLAPVCESLVTNGQWWPVPYARAKLCTVEGEGSITLSHTGYARATPVSRHERRICPEESGVVVVDSFEGSGSTELTLCWQFGAGFDRFEADALTVIGADARVELTIDGVQGPAAVESTFGGRRSGWASPEYGHKSAALCVQLRWQVDLPLVVSTRFRFVSCAA